MLCSKVKATYASIRNTPIRIRSSCSTSNSPSQLECMTTGHNSCPSPAEARCSRLEDRCDGHPSRDAVMQFEDAKHHRPKRNATLERQQRQVVLLVCACTALYCMEFSRHFERTKLLVRLCMLNVCSVKATDTGYLIVCSLAHHHDYTIEQQHR